jgi:hypothetical protein
MSTCANILLYMGRLLVIYVFAPDPSEFHNIGIKKILFSFLSVLLADDGG